MSTQVAIIGAGPAGIAAAMQMKRMGIDPLVFEKSEIGGLLRHAWKVENYLGFPEGISGMDLVRRFQSHASRLGVCIIKEEVITADWRRGAFWLHTASNAHLANRLVIASGTRPVSTHGIVISLQAKKKVFAGFPFAANPKGKHVVVIGGGDVALDYALNLARENEVRLFIRGNHVRALPLLQRQAKKNPHIQWSMATPVHRISSSGSRLTIHAVVEGKPLLQQADIVVLAMGREPELGFVAAGMKKAWKRLLAEGALYLVGDVANGSLRQVGIGVGEGIKAAMKIAWVGKGIDG